MAAEGESLGRSRLDLEANLDEFRRNMREGGRLADGMDDRLRALAAVADIAENALGDVKMSSTAAAESERIASRIERSVGRDGRAAMEATQHLQEVKLSAGQAVETELVGHSIMDVLDAINRHANETNRALDRLAAKRGIIGRPGAGVGPFGSGYGRLGVLGTAVGAGALAAPAVAPAALGLLASIPTLAAGGIGALGALTLAFAGMGKAIGGDAQAFKELGPAQQRFTLTVRSLIPELDRLKQAAGANLFPGLTRGLRDALSPGTVNAISAAVVTFSRAIGQAGEQWGRYFGSARFQQIFGPLMQAGARNLGLLSDAALKLFDAFGVLGRAAIPLTSWLVTAADRGAQLADTWIRAADGSGRLASAMGEAQTSLRLVGGVLVAAGRAFGALGAAIYPVSKVFLADLTDGLNALAGIIRRNQGLIRDVLGRALADAVATIKAASSAIGVLSHAFSQLGPVAKGVIIGVGAALAIAFGPESVAVTGAVLAVGEIIRHWTAVKTWFSNFGRFFVNVFEAAWTGVKGVFNLGIYAVLVNIELLTKGLKAALGWVPGLGGKIKSALESVDSFIEQFRQRGVAELSQAGVDMGNAWGYAFTTAAQRQVNAFLKRAAALKSPGAQLLGPPIPTTKTKTRKPPAPSPINTSAISAFGTSPPFDKNVPKAKQPPLLPPGAQHALDLGAANANRADNATGKAVETYLGREIVDLETAAKLIRQKYEGAVGKVRTQLFTALTGVLNKIRSTRAKLREAIYNDKLADFQFALDLAQLAMDNAREGSAAYLRAQRQEEKLLRAEIAYLDKRVRNKKLSLALREDALQAEIAAKEQLNALLGQTAAAGNGANERQFLSSFQSIVHDYAPNAFPEQPSTKPLETKGYETVQELRGIRHVLDRIAAREDFPASGYAVASAEAAFA